MQFKHSIKNLLMRWVLIPMAVLIIADTFLIYNQARRIESQIFNHELEDLANDISLILKERNADNVYSLTTAEATTLLSDKEDKVFYSIVDDHNQWLAGNAHLALPLAKTAVLTDRFQQQRVKTISVPAYLNVQGKPSKVWIQVAQTTHKRDDVRSKIFLVIFLPQILLLLTSTLFIYLGTRISLKPINRINDAISSLSFRALKPIDETNIPVEIENLVKSLNKLTNDLSAAIKSQDTFIVDFAHQLRTPLAGLLSQVELLQAIKDPKESKKRLGYVMTNAEKLIHLVNQLLRLAKNQPEALINVKMMKIDLVQAVKSAQGDLMSYAESHDIQIQSSIPNKAIHMMGDALRIYDLIFNLIENAIKYSTPNSNVWVTLKDEGEHVRLEVKDEGIGISKEDLPHVFERFYRGKNSDEFGTGVGLSIVKEIADFHHAKLNVASEGVGQGAVFSVTFSKV
jgi:two-component system sensor histidine kinase TctE